MTNTQSPKALAARWQSDAGLAASEEVLARLMSGRALTDLGLGEHEGRVDLRGLPAPTPKRLARFETRGWFVETLGDLVTLRGVSLSGLDLCGAQLQSFRLHDVTLDDCRLDVANCRDWRMWRTRVRGCSFVKTNLREAVVGSWSGGRRNEWNNVDFTGADFRVVNTEAASFEDCTFHGAKVIDVDFLRCRLVRCKFTGPLTKVRFDGRRRDGQVEPEPLRDVDFSGAVFDQVEFWGYLLDRVLPPDDPDVVVISRYPCVLRHGLALLAGDESRSARMTRAVFESRVRGLRTVDEEDFYNRRDELFHGEDHERFVANLLRAAQAACA